MLVIQSSYFVAKFAIFVAKFTFKTIKEETAVLHYLLLRQTLHQFKIQVTLESTAVKNKDYILIFK